MRTLKNAHDEFKVCLIRECNTSDRHLRQAGFPGNKRIASLNMPLSHARDHWIWILMLPRRLFYHCHCFWEFQKEHIQWGLRPIPRVDFAQRNFSALRTPRIRHTPNATSARPRLKQYSRGRALFCFCFSLCVILLCLFLFSQKIINRNAACNAIPYLS